MNADVRVAQARHCDDGVDEAPIEEHCRISVLPSVTSADTQIETLIPFLESGPGEPALILAKEPHEKGWDGNQDHRQDQCYDRIQSLQSRGKTEQYDGFQAADNRLQIG